VRAPPGTLVLRYSCANRTPVLYTEGVRESKGGRLPQNLPGFLGLGFDTLSLSQTRGERKGGKNGIQE